MNKEQYLRNKGILPKDNIGTIYTFHSNRIDGVAEIVEHQIWTQRVSGHAYIDMDFDSTTKKEIICYNIKDTPYECRITEGKTIGQDIGSGSGFGDLWSWTNFYSLNKEDLEQVREKEIERVYHKYGKKDDVELQLEHIETGLIIVKDDNLFLGSNMFEHIAWSQDINDATIFDTESREIDMHNAILTRPNVKSIPVKKVSQYQLGEF